MTTILVADDISVNRYLLTSIFKGVGYEVVVATNGADALELAQKSPPDLIITDILMPVMDGFELCRRWKTDERLKTIPLIFYTATYTDSKDERLALSLGADRFVIKPAKPESLMDVVREVLEETRQQPPSFFEKPLGEEMEVLRQYNAALFRKLEQKMIQLQAEIAEHKKAEEARKTLEEKLRVSQKMEAIGSLAGGVAHDFNNMLNIIYGYAQLSLRGLNENDPLYENIQQIINTCDRAAGLTRQLLAFSRKQVLQPVVLNLNQIIGEFEKMLRRVLGEDVDFIMVLAPDLGVVRADSSQIEQVLLNLVVNARDAMPEGGKLTVETSNVNIGQEYTAHHVDVKPGPYVQLTVSDTGHGMDAQTQARVFEPFFTTKGSGQGTGLGLSTVYGIVTQSGGNVTVYSEPGRGTTFKIYLPRELLAAAAATAPPMVVRTVTGTETVLAVEDEKLMRKFAKKSLETAGYTVLMASDGDEALQIAAQHAGNIHLLLTDRVMPRMNGRTIAQALTKARPTLKVLYMSSYADASIVHDSALDAGTYFITKPFTVTALLRKVREVLDGASIAG